MQKVKPAVTGGRKKILFIITQNEMGGAQKFLQYFTPYLKNKSFNIVLASGENRNPLLTGVKLKHLQRSPNPLQGLLAIREIYKLLKTERPDVLFLCSSMAGFLGSIAGWLYKKFPPRQTTNCQLQTIYRIGGWAFNDPRPRWQKTLIIAAEKATARLKDKIIVNSEYDQQSALRNKVVQGQTLNKLIKIHNGIDAEKITFLDKQTARQKLGLPENEFIIGAIANLYKTKGLEYLIKAMSEVRPQTLAVIIGEGKERKNLESLIKKLGLQNKVLLFGRKENASQYLKAFDAFVLPSLKEGFPWVILEAIAAGLPIIATKVGALPEILEDKKTGLLTDPGDTKQLVNAILELINSPDLRSALSQNSKTRIADFPLSKMLAETEQIINPRV